MIDENIISWAKDSSYEDLGVLFKALQERHPKDLLTAIMEVLMPGSEGESALPELLQVGEFLRKVGTPPPMLIEKLIPDHGLVLVAGRPKHAKSYLALDIMDTVCMNQMVLQSRMLSKTGPVIYLGMEDGQYEIANRLLKRGIKIGDGRAFHLCTTHMNISKPETIPHLLRMMDQVEPVLVCIDTAREACGIKDWNDPSEITEKLRPLRKLAHERCSILLVAHNRKAEGTNGDEISGSNAFGGAVDGWISIQRKEKLSNGNLRLFAEMDGRAMMGEIVMEMDTHTLHFRTIPEEELMQEKESGREAERSKREELAAKAISKLGGRATVAMISSETGLGYETTRNIIREMAEKGLVKESGVIKPDGAGRPAPAFSN